MKLTKEDILKADPRKVMYVSLTQEQYDSIQETVKEADNKEENKEEDINKDGRI